MRRSTTACSRYQKLYLTQSGSMHWWATSFIVANFVAAVLFGSLRRSTASGGGRTERAADGFPKGAPLRYFPPCFLSTFAQVSFNATVRLKTDLPGFESGSAQKYPRRSNW